MTNIIRLKVENFRGINNLELDIPVGTRMVCFAGRGDSCKTTILDAISLALSPVWNTSFRDTDFYKCNTNYPIKIKVTLSGIPPSLMSESKFGLFKRFMNVNGVLHDDVLEAADSDVEVLTICLSVYDDLEPSWVVSTEREQEDRIITASDRSKLNGFLVSDYIDKHFTWGKGSPLYSLLRSQIGREESDTNSLLNEAIREIKRNVDSSSFPHMNGVSECVKNKAEYAGLELPELSTALDVKDLSLKDGKLTLHSSGIPVRMLGKGSKRLVSICIQLELSNEGGIVLIDEIEQGLEPDRIRLLSRILKENEDAQIFMTTHSREVIAELGVEDIFIVHRDDFDGTIKVMDLPHDRISLQKAIRACSDAFFAKKVLVCEGATEVGICRSLDSYRRSLEKLPLAHNHVTYIDGTGNSLVERAKEIASAGIDVCLLCDSDEKNTNGKKKELLDIGACIIDCIGEYSIEQQVFSDLPWNAVIKLIGSVEQYWGYDTKSMNEKIKAKYLSGEFPNDWQNQESRDLREAIAKSSVVKGKEWFKNVTAGQILGDLLFSHIGDLSGTGLGKYLEGLASWVDN